MIAQPPISESLWNTVPPEPQAAILVVLESYEARIAQLEQRIGDLEARLKLNSTNSSKPPSSDPIGLKRKPPTPPSRRKRGGQPGHRKAFRALVPPEKLRSSTECKPGSCRRCGHALHGEDPTPLIHQVADLPRIEPLVDEYPLLHGMLPQLQDGLRQRPSPPGQRSPRAARLVLLLPGSGPGPDLHPSDDPVPVHRPGLRQRPFVA